MGLFRRQPSDRFRGIGLLTKIGVFNVQFRGPYNPGFRSGVKTAIIDATGKVTQVAIQKSSGSNELDQPTLIALYDWWFEPLHDAKGIAVPDCVLFKICFR